MATTYPLSTLATTLTATGITGPSFVDILESLKASFRLIYGQDAYLEPDSQDGQLLAIFAQGIYDSNQQAIAVYNSFSPATAVGTGLSNVVKINHIQREPASKSQVNVRITGTAGTTIQNGVVSDEAGNRWDLPPSFSIPPAGSIEVTATAQNEGNIVALAGTVTTIETPVAGWQSVTNLTAASPGNAVETDAHLRTRQQIAPALNSYTVMGGLLANLQALTGVDYAKVYENDTNATDALGLPAHSIAAVVRGGILQSIVETIYKLKGQGVSTYGTTSGTVTDPSGTTHTINFFVPVEKALKVTIAITAQTNYTSAIGDRIKQAIADYINGMDVGESLVVTRLYTPALLNGSVDNETYKITSLLASLLAGTPGTADVAIAFNEKATCSIANITLTVT